MCKKTCNFLTLKFCSWQVGYFLPDRLCYISNDDDDGDGDFIFQLSSRPLVCCCLANMTSMEGTIYLVTKWSNLQISLLLFLLNFTQTEHSSPLRLVQIPDCPRHSNQSNSILTLLNYVIKCSTLNNTFLRISGRYPSHCIGSPLAFWILYEEILSRIIEGHFSQCKLKYPLPPQQVLAKWEDQIKCCPIG